MISTLSYHFQDIHQFTLSKDLLWSLALWVIIAYNDIPKKYYILFCIIFSWLHNTVKTRVKKEHMTCHLKKLGPGQFKKSKKITFPHLVSRTNKRNSYASQISLFIYKLNHNFSSCTLSNYLGHDSCCLRSQWTISLGLVYGLPDRSAELCNSAHLTTFISNFWPYSEFL